jgi:hypothetical protein
VKKLRLGMQPITHRMKKVKVQWPLDPSLEGAFRKPDDLTIITINTTGQKGYFERSLDFLGIEDYVVLKGEFEGPWRHVLKIGWIVDYLESGECGTPYLLYCDSFDSILRDDSQKVLDIFLRMGKMIVFGSTMSRRGIFTHFPDLFEWTLEVGKKSGRYLNAGTFIGETEFVRKVYGVAEGMIGIYPRTDYSDQDIFRYLHPVFYPHMDVDYFNELFYRN